jgi:NSS family neurotransmitter:Na+ symporter
LSLVPSIDFVLNIPHNFAARLWVYKSKFLRNRATGRSLTVSKREEFASRWGFLAAAIGMAVGTGNIWRFPRMAAQYGGGAFILAYTLALFLWSAPLLMTEMAIGRKTRLGPIGGFRDFIGRRYTWMGAWMVMVCMLITFYYAVVTGWCIKYFTLALSGAFRQGADTASIWHRFQHDPWQNAFFLLLSVLLAGLVIYRGVGAGVEKVSKIMVPALFVFLLVAAIRTVTLPGAGQGLSYLFVPDWSRLGDPATWLQAFTQSAWSTGAGWGLMLTYAVYTRKNEDVPQNAFTIGFGDHAAALLAGLIIIPTVFALSATQADAQAAMTGGNTGLTFISLAGLFPRIPGGFLIAPIFFLAMLFAAFSSLIAQVETGVRTFIDGGWSRKKSTVTVVLAALVLGLPSAIFPGFLDNQDWVWGVALLLSGFFIIFAAWRYGAERIRTELLNPGAGIRMGRWWSLTITYVSPVIFIGLTAWWLYRGIADNPKTWWQPFATFSTMTILWQWALLLMIVLGLNRFLGRWIKKAPEEAE